MIGITVGTGLSDDVLRGFTLTSIVVDGERVELYVGRLGGAEALLLPRHGVRGTVGPHRIDHARNLSALRDMGAIRVIGISSAGSLKRNIRPPTIVIPDDYIELLPATVHDGPVHVVPGLSGEVRRALIDAVRALGIRPFHDRGVYVQTVGPRLETRAEVAFHATFADVVGMTMGSEATVAAELGIGYASLCTVDNYAHGIGPAPDFEEIARTARENTARAWGAVERAVVDLSKTMR